MNFDERYGLLDRGLYRLAFRLGTAQHALADVEDLLYGDALDGIEADDPVFITALPRAGTTILLKLLWETGRFASHTYQDMPFVLCPLLWSRYAGQFGTDIEATERAHGDGLEVSGRSPEAFEEMIWKHFWDGPYRADHIRPWTDVDRNPEFERFFETHMRKVIAVRSNGEADKRRYLSKNNLNIARLAALPEPLRRGTLVIPFRDPLQQAASMHRQHERFLDIHEDDDFVREYMEAIGHHEFGKGLKPVNFNGWLDDDLDLNPASLSYWVRYWIAAYRFVIEHTGENVVLISYERLTAEPHASLARLADRLEISGADLTSQADRVESPRTHAVEAPGMSESLRRRAAELHEQLEQQALK
ncbi:sulfotransferase domain-containing protein [Salinibacter ruber]|uniref:sulfotransferase domain-containing protein n=1 Tax=Salinibacter ruber TaxID=146919 RepID=UPI000E575785|nr:sulfotransferase domain-containing protein [Salinibacter ruber]